jgi:hypothetical protein
MKRFIIFGLMLALVVPSLQARRKKEKAGTVQDMVYTDKKYNFKLTIDDGWKYKIKPNKENFRLILTQKNYEIPSNYLDAPDYTYVPRIVVYADTSSMSVFAFLDSLLRRTYSSAQKKEMLKEFEFINEMDVEEGTEREPIVTKRRIPIEIGGEPGVRWEGQVQYVKYVTTSASSLGGKRVYGAYGGGIVVAKKGKNVVVFHVMSEWDFFRPVMDEALMMIKTLQWVDEADTKEGKKK